jgi:hypothetical protein
MADGKTELQKRLSNHLHALQSQFIVVLDRAAIIRVAFDHNNQVRKIMEDLLERRSDLSEGALFVPRQSV